MVAKKSIPTKDELKTALREIVACFDREYVDQMYSLKLSDASELSGAIEDAHELLERWSK